MSVEKDKLSTRGCHLSGCQDSNKETVSPKPWNRIGGLEPGTGKSASHLRVTCELTCGHLRDTCELGAWLASPCESLVLSVILRLRNGLGVSYHLLSHYLRFYFRYFFKTKLVHCWVYIGIMRLRQVNAIIKRTLKSLMNIVARGIPREVQFLVSKIVESY